MASTKKTSVEPDEGKEVINILRSFVKKVNPFALNLFIGINNIRNEGNILVSPLFVQAILAITYIGNPIVSEQVSNFFHLPKNREEAIAAYLVLMQFIQYKCGRIKTFQIDNVIRSLQSMVLLSATYFKTRWFQCIVATRREKRDFNITDTVSFKMNMLTINDELKILQHDQLDSKIIEIPCEENNYSMIIILPNQNTGLKSVINEITSSVDLIEEVAKLKNTEPVLVEVLLPEFRLSQTLDLKKILISTGLDEMFDVTKIDLPDVSDSPFFVNNVLIKTCIELYDDGLQCSGGIHTKMDPAWKGVAAFSKLPCYHSSISVIYHQNVDKNA
ncbi:serpin B10-like [Lycorma delicatula]|uniref:serpin B10-like n=1 Tax=Lycorma delicatula TaxID=130591 RepID=UPI003F519689